MKNCNNLTLLILANQPRVTTVAGPQTISFRKIKRKRRAKTSAHAQIQILSPTVDEVMTYNEGKKYLRGLWKVSFKNLRQEKESRESNVA